LFRPLRRRTTARRWRLLERLTSLTPRPRINLLLHYGVLGARSAWRSRIAAIDRERSEARSAVTRDGVSVPGRPDRPKTNSLSAKLMQRSFRFNVLACPRCGDRLELIALIDNPSVIRRILSHLGVPTEVPTARPAIRAVQGRSGADRIRGHSVNFPASLLSGEKRTR
jgi:hypothetical protein